MPQNLLAIHGVPGLVVAVGEGGKITMFTGDVYHPLEVVSPTRATLRGVYVESAQRAWAIGDEGTVLTWDGTRWYPVALAAKHDGLHAVWGHSDGPIWIGGDRTLFNYYPAIGTGTLLLCDYSIRAIWGSGPTDVWFLCDGRMVMHGTGAYCAAESLPGDEDEEWSALAGSDPDTSVYIVGVEGLVMEWTGEQWMEFGTGTKARLLSAACAGPDLYVTTDTGQVRCWAGDRWRTVAFSAFGALNACCFVDGVLWCCGDRGVVLQHQPDDGGRKE